MFMRRCIVTVVFPKGAFDEQKSRIYSIRMGRSAETQSPLIYEKDIETRKRIERKSISFLVSLEEWNVYGVLKTSEARERFRGKDLNRR